MSAAPTNLLLDSLSASCRNQILAIAKPVSLPLRESLIEPGVQLEHAYFMTSGIASVVVELAEGRTTEVALIGREGLVGAVDMLGPNQTPSRCFIQMTATAYRVPYAALRALFMENEEIRMRILEFVQQQSMGMSQLVACNKLHEVEPRLARWLLMVQNRVENDTLHLTQEFLAQMLGSQRTTVVAAAGVLQRRGLLEYRRGKVTIVSREGLESVACECFEVANRLLKNLYREKVSEPGVMQLS